MLERQQRLQFNAAFTLVALACVVVRAGRLPFGITRRSSSISTRVLHEAFTTSRIGRAHSDFSLSSLNQLRGGEIVDVDDEEEEEEEEEESDEEEEEEDEVTDEEDDDEKEEKEAVDIEEDSDEKEQSESPLSSIISMHPIPINVKTALGNSLLDQAIELTVNRSRNVASLKQSCSRQLSGRPPVAAMRLLFNGKVLHDDMLVDELLDDEDEEEDEEVEEEGGARLVLQLDMVPPVDPKFVPRLEAQMQDLTNSELLDAYVANEAALYQNAALLMQEETSPVSDQDEDEDKEKEEVDTSSQPLISFQLREHAARIRQDLETKLLTSEQSQKVLQDDKPPSAKQFDLTKIEVRGNRVRKVAGAGVKTGIKRKIQKNLNVNWADTIRHFCLFLFFGYFGGRTPTSRAILLLGAPSVFVLQWRPMKLWIKQLCYALLDHPPGIFLSLLPAPQQTILSINISKAMRVLYGNDLLDSQGMQIEDSGEDDDLLDRMVDTEDDDEEEEEEEETDEYYSAAESDDEFY